MEGKHLERWKRRCHRPNQNLNWHTQPTRLMLTPVPIAQVEKHRWRKLRIPLQILVKAVNASFSTYFPFFRELRLNLSPICSVKPRMNVQKLISRCSLKCSSMLAAFWIIWAYRVIHLLASIYIRLSVKINSCIIDLTRSVPVLAFRKKFTGDQPILIRWVLHSNSKEISIMITSLKSFMQNLTFVLPWLVFLMNFSFSFSEPRCGQGGLYSQLDKETVSVKSLYS